MMKLFILTTTFALKGQRESRITGAFESRTLAEAAQTKVEGLGGNSRIKFKITEVELNTPADWGGC